MAERRTLDRLLSRSGLCSRTVAARLVREGRVRVNGQLARTVETWVEPGRDAVTIDGRPLRSAEALYLCLNKPKGVLTTFGDPRGRRTVYDLLEHVPEWVFPVGRLDRDTSGLLLLTNDTELAERIAGPRFGVPKLYRAAIAPRIEEAALAPLAAGIVLDDGPALPTPARLVGHRGPTSVVEIELREGRNRQVRRMFRALGHRVRELRRLAIGPVQLGDLASGATRALSDAERRALERMTR